MSILTLKYFFSFFWIYRRKKKSEKSFLFKLFKFEKFLIIFKNFKLVNETNANELKKIAVNYHLNCNFYKNINNKFF